MPELGTAKVFDLAGKQLWSGDEGFAGWADSGNLLMFGKDGVAGHALATGKTTALDSGPQGYGGWDATYLTCPTPEGIFSWRYR